MAVLCLAYNGLAGEISSGLADQMNRGQSTEMIPVIIFPQKAGLSGSVSKAGYQEFTLSAERYYQAINRLKSKANSDQAGLLEELRRLEKSGLVSGIKGHWIINAIEVEVAVSEVGRLAVRDDVTLISERFEIEMIRPVQEEAVEAPAFGGAYTPYNILWVGADSVWQLGYDGQGSVVCSFDSGVRFLHPALYRSWKGHDGDSSAAWFDPVGGGALPEDYDTHGTHTMGTMVGRDTVSDYNIGVAPGARWITAVTSTWGCSIIDAFEWAANPDGDPNTIDDIPDVINHSWGLHSATVGCYDYFWEMIDNTEALGIINIFAAGNEGVAGPMTIRNPANRAFDSLDCFAVGAMGRDTINDTIRTFSSRGPSECDGMSIKPNVVAPGDDIWSAAGSAYSVYDGTSMAAPHVSGAVAILRQFAPNASPALIKEALLHGCRRLPDGATEPNNDYGWGFIYIPSALEALDSLMRPFRPDLRVYSYDHPPVNPGETVSSFLALRNFGPSVDSVFARVADFDDALTIISDSLFFGMIDSNQIVSGHIPFEAQISDTVDSGTTLTVDFDLSGSGNYNSSIRLYIQAGRLPSADFYTHKNDVIHFTISNFGQYGFSGGSFNPLGMNGFRYLDTLRNDLHEGAFLVGIDADHVSDGARNIAKEPDNDFGVSADGQLIVSSPGSRADQETYCVFNDSRAEHPLGLEIEQRTYMWTESPDDNYLILEFVMRNLGETPLDNLYAGLFMDWNLHGQKKDLAGFSEADNLGYMYGPSIAFPPTPARYRGMAVLNDEGLSSHSLLRTVLNPSIPPAGDDTTFIWRESRKASALSSGILEAVDSIQSFDLAHTVATGPFFILPGFVDTAVFALVAADTNELNMIGTVDRARAAYQMLTAVEPENEAIIPERISLRQNYPNPFNQSTTISFSLDRRQEVSVSIFNVAGERVAELVKEKLGAGRYQLRWDGRDMRGRPVASGIYFYRLVAGESSLTRKMSLIK